MLTTDKRHIFNVINFPELEGIIKILQFWLLNFFSFLSFVIRTNISLSSGLVRTFLCGIEIEGFSDVVDDVFIRAITYFFSGCLRAAAIEEIVSINNGSFFISRWRDGISKWRSILREKAQQHYRRPTQTLRARYVIKSQFFLCGEGRRLRYSSSLSNRTITITPLFQIQDTARK